MVHNRGETLFGSRLPDQDFIIILWMRHDRLVPFPNTLISSIRNTRYALESRGQIGTHFAPSRSCRIRFQTWFPSLELRSTFRIHYG